MHDYDFDASLIRSILAAAGVTIAIAAFAVLGYGLQGGSAEVGPLETAQEWLLIAAFGGLFLTATAQPNGAPRLASIFGAVLAIVMFLRELEPVDKGAIATYLQSGSFRVHETIVIAILLAVCMLPNRHHLPEIVRWLCSRASWPLFLAGLFLVGGEWMDGRHYLFGIEWLPRFIEETFETFAYAVIFACAARWLTISGRFASRHA